MCALLLLTVVLGQEYSDDLDNLARIDVLKKLAESGKNKELLKIYGETEYFEVAVEIQKLIMRRVDTRGVGRFLAEKREVVAMHLEYTLRKIRTPRVRDYVVSHGLRKKNPHVLRATIVAAGVWENPAAREPLLKIARTRRDVALRYEATRALARIGGDGVTEHLLRCAQDKDWRMRLAAAEFKTTMDLASDPHPRVREAASGKREPAAKRPVLFLVDISSEANDLSRALDNSLAALDVATPFTVMAFEKNVKVWKRTAVPATVMNKRAASVWFAKLRKKRTGCDLGKALQAAMANETVREVRIFHDGYALFGNPAWELAARIRHRNRYGRIRFEAGLPYSAEVVETIVEQSGGKVD